MSQHYFEIDSEKERVVLHYDGDVTLDSLMSITREIHGNPAYSPDFDGIGILLESNLLLSYKEMNTFVDLLRLQTRHMTGHFVFVYDTPTKFGVGRMFQTLSEDISHTIHFCKTLKEAHQLLDQQRSLVPDYD